MPFKWSSDAERQMLIWIAVLEDIRPTTEHMNRIVELLDDTGELNANGATQKFYKLKRDSDALLKKEGGEDVKAEADAKTTPIRKTTAKATTPSSSKTPKTPGTGRGRKRKNVEGTNNNDEQVGKASTKSKSKKPKMEVTESEGNGAKSENEENPSVKTEEDGDSCENDNDTAASAGTDAAAENDIATAIETED